MDVVVRGQLGLTSITGRFDQLANAEFYRCEEGPEDKPRTLSKHRPRMSSLVFRPAILE
jgi:hypothetical protein